jgi:dynein heavy chain
VTFDGLEEQLLVDVVKNEVPEVEIKRDSLVVEISTSKNELKRLENKILKDLADSNQDTILDNEDLIETLEISKTKSKVITVSLSEAEEVEQQINETRNKYRDVSVRGSILYFVIADLASIDPMYQNSLSYIKKLFNEAIVQTEKNEDLQERIDSLLNSITKMLYINICRGLFEAHKIIYSFLICTSIKRRAKLINEI